MEPAQRRASRPSGQAANRPTGQSDPERPPFGERHFGGTDRTVGNIIGTCLGAAIISGGIPEALNQPQTACALACVSNRAHATPSTRHYARRASNNHKCICESTAGSVGGVGTPLRASRLTLQPCNALGATIATTTSDPRATDPLQNLPHIWPGKVRWHGQQQGFLAQDER